MSDTAVLSLPELDRAVPANFTAYLRLFARLPGMALHEEPDITWFESGGRAPGNHVLRTQLDPAGDLDGRLRQLVAQITAQVDRLDWPLYPADGPPDVGARLAALGFTLGLGGPWMVADLCDLPALPAAPAELTLVQVADAARMRAWHTVSAAGFEMSMEAVQPYHDAYAFDGFSPEAMQTHRHYLGLVAGVPVTSATLILAAGVAGVYDVSTPPRWRRRGYGAAITALTLAEARAAGYRYACLTASPEGERVYRRLGFRHHMRPVEVSWRRPAIR